jgi:tryptophan 2,3-dioxygenase
VRAEAVEGRVTLLHMPNERFDEQIETDFRSRLDYQGYLHLDKILGAQEPLSNPVHHDEPLFIIQHQTSELWMKLTVHELSAAVQHVRENELEPCFKILARVKQIQRMLFEQWAVLETLTPSEYAEFRHVLGHASGLQSFQFRMIEFLYGNKDAKALGVFKHHPIVHAGLTQLLHAPSLYDEFLRYLSRKGFAIPQSQTDRDWSLPYAPDSAVTEVFRKIYEHPREHWAEYEMAEKLVDVEEGFALWRFRHILTVERIIGFKRGTGGSSGVGFLRAGLDQRLFPEIWDVRTLIGT